MSGVISLNPLFIKSMSLTSERFIRRKACRRLNPLFIKSMSLTVWRGCGNMTGSAWSQSFIHQVYVSHIIDPGRGTSRGQLSQSFIHQVYVSHFFLFRFVRIRAGK